MPRDLSQTKVAVIGAGPQGLCALKNLLEEGFGAVLLEQRDCIGGLWAYTDDPNTTTVLSSTLTNVSKYKNCYADFPIGTDEPVYSTQTQFLGYLERYTDAFNLRPHIQLNTSVLAIAKSQTSTSGWDIKVKSSSTSTEREIHFDKVVLATGAHNTQQLPTIPNSSLFRGKIIHSSAFKNPADYVGQRVMVVGFSNTAADISAELIRHAVKPVFVAHRKGIYVLPRIVNGKPVDLFANRRIATIGAAMTAIAPVHSLSIMNKTLENMSDRCWELDPAWRFRPAPSRVSNRVMLSDTFVPQLHEGSIRAVANVARILDGETVELEDGSREAVDCIVFCTGYQRRDPPFLSEVEAGRVVDGGKSSIVRHRLYQNIFPPAHADSIAFLDCWQLGTGICEIADLACMAITQIWKGSSALPSEDEMNKAIDQHHRWVDTVLSNEPMAAAKVVQEGKWRAWLNAAAGTSVNELLGYGPKGWWFWMTQPKFCGMLMSGIDSPHVTRLFDGKRKKWDGARDAIVAANEDVNMRFGKGGSEKKKR